MATWPYPWRESRNMDFGENYGTRAVVVLSGRAVSMPRRGQYNPKPPLWQLIALPDLAGDITADVSV